MIILIKTVTLDNGLKIVLENIPYVRSIAFGIWINTGTRCEKPEENGVSHFIEHMMFKGTEKRNAKEIAEEMDAMCLQTQSPVPTPTGNSVYAPSTDVRFPLLALAYLSPGNQTNKEMCIRDSVDT